MNYIPYREGKVYDKAHLRPFDLDLAKQGHSLALSSGAEIRLFRETRIGIYGFDYWLPNFGWSSTGWYNDINDLNLYLRLAPLAVRDGRPLHVGDVIEVEGRTYLNEWFIKVFELKDSSHITSKSKVWRFPNDEKAKDIL